MSPCQVTGFKVDARRRRGCTHARASCRNAKSRSSPVGSWLDLYCDTIRGRWPIPSCSRRSGAYCRDLSFVSSSWSLFFLSPSHIRLLWPFVTASVFLRGCAASALFYALGFARATKGRCSLAAAIYSAVACSTSALLLRFGFCSGPGPVSFRDGSFMRRMVIIQQCQPRLTTARKRPALNSAAKIH